ncbi:MAG: hypothetical protein Ct9H300mP22_1830 [Gammaproteobacteria bacterium]|nr:MAG: hypothetical protein Ct9H300mP22_1830 [Gammaproteobacteria bacterium]
MVNEEINVVILDELTYMLTYGYLDKEMVFEALKNRPTYQHVVITGRNASKELVKLADTVSEVADTKNAFNTGIKVQKREKTIETYKKYYTRIFIEFCHNSKNVCCY